MECRWGVWGQGCGGVGGGHEGGREEGGKEGGGKERESERGEMGNKSECSHSLGDITACLCTCMPVTVLAPWGAIPHYD